MSKMDNPGFEEDSEDRAKRKTDPTAAHTWKAKLKLLPELCAKNCRSIRVQFIVVYAGVLFFYGMSVSYTNSVLVSIERRFHFSTTQIGGILAATEIGHIAMAMFVAHFFGNRHRPRWICYGTVLMAVALLLFATPELLLPAIDSVFPGPSLCTNSGKIHNQIEHFNSTGNHTIEAGKKCGGSGTTSPLIIFCIAHVLHGLGSTTPMVLGMPYVDDNVNIKNVPLYFGHALVGRLLGPLCGFALGAICSSIYLDFTRPPFSPNDPRWISAWYIGFIVIAGGLIVTGVLIGFFPYAMPPEEKPQEGDRKALEADGDTSALELVQCSTVTPDPTFKPRVLSLKSWKVLLVDLKRLFTNIAFICRTSSMFVDGMVISGVFNYIPKYYAQQFQISQTQAAILGGTGFLAVVDPLSSRALVAGFVLVIAVIVGIVVGSIVIKRLKLQPRHIALCLVIPSLILAIGLFISIGLGCETTEMVGLPALEKFHEGRDSVVFDVNYCQASQGCGCSLQKFEPLHEPHSRLSFYSPCFAGCPMNATKTVRYRNCHCLAETAAALDLEDLSFGHANRSSRFNPDLIAGLLPKTKACDIHKIALTIVLVIAVFFEGMPMSGQIIVQFRVVDEDLKNLCAGITSLCVAAFGLLPGPIFMGKIVDSTCRLWQTTACGEHGACFLYDTEDFRWKFFLTGGCLKLITVVLDSVVAWKVWKLPLQRSPDEPSLSLCAARSSKPSIARPAPASQSEAAYADITKAEK